MRSFEEGDEGGGIYFFLLGKKYLMRQLCILLGTLLLLSEHGSILFSMTFLSDAGDHVDLYTNLEWPYDYKFFIIKTQ